MGEFTMGRSIASLAVVIPSLVGASAVQAVELAECGAVAPPTYITVRAVAGEPYERIVDCELGPMPEACEAAY